MDSVMRTTIEGIILRRIHYINQLCPDLEMIISKMDLENAAKIRSKKLILHYLPSEQQEWFKCGDPRLLVWCRENGYKKLHQYLTQCLDLAAVQDMMGSISIA
jgi:hypothetical protein